MSEKHQKKLVKQKGGANLAEEVLRQSGKSEDEVKRTGKIDRADDQVEILFDEKHRTTSSPVHRAVWENSTPLSLFRPPHLNLAEPCHPVMNACLTLVQERHAQGTLYDPNGKVSEESIRALAEAGYWGMLIDPEYGGQGASMRSFMSFLTHMSATGCPTTAGLASIHGCIGAVDPVRTFGNPEQQKRFLPVLASGQKISGFALTEPSAGSDLTALKTTAVLDGDDYVINGEKLFISNAIHSRIIGLVCLIEAEDEDGQKFMEPNVLVVELPNSDNGNFQLVHYELHALTHTYNNGLLFKNFRVPKANLLKAEVNGKKAGDGLTIAYHGLNRGRVALCANSAGVMRIILRSITPASWGQFRKTYGESIERRELVKARIARLASLILGADALVAWCASLLDEGYRGELECIIAKIFGSEAQKEAAIEIGMKTHGGRSFLKGHLIGDNIHDYLAPLIYEGEGQMLAMAFFKGLAKQHGMSYMLPLGQSVNTLAKSTKRLRPVGVLSGLSGLSWNGLRYALWQAGKRLPHFNRTVPGMDSRLKGHVAFVQQMLRQLPLELSAAMVKHQLKLADRQCRINYLSQRTQDTFTMLVACQYAHQAEDAATIAAADILCRDFYRKLTGAQPTDDDFKAASHLADLVIEGKFHQLEGVPETPILRRYQA